MRRKKPENSDDKDRGTGRTTRQLQTAASEGYIFGVHNRGMKEHAAYLCEKHGIKGVSVIVVNQDTIQALHGRTMRHIHLDHAALARLDTSVLRAVLELNNLAHA